MIIGFGKFIDSSYKYQILATIAVNILTFSHGIGLGWVAPMLALLRSSESPLGHIITVKEASWIGACLSAGSLLGNLIFGQIIDRIGRKRTLLLLAVPHICFWLTVYYASEVYHLYIARILCGTTGGGSFITIPIFIAEIADNKIRGSLSSFFMLVFNSGILGGFILSSYLSYNAIPRLVILLPFIFLSMVTLFPETPRYLLKAGKETEAENSLKFYRNHPSSASKESIQNFNNYFINFKSDILALKGNEQKLTLNDLVTTNSLKALGIGLALMLLNQFCGVFAIINYSSIIFAASGSNLSPNISTIIIGVIQILGTYTATILVDRFGRKILLTISSMGMCLGLSVAGTYSHLSHHYDLSILSWLPLVSLSFVIFIASIGVGSVTFVILVEILPPKIRSLGSMICLMSLSVIMFTVLKTFPILLAAIGFSGLMWICASFSGIGMLFIVICVPETKGKSLENDNFLK